LCSDLTLESLFDSEEVSSEKETTTFIVKEFVLYLQGYDLLAIRWTILQRFETLTSSESGNKLLFFFHTQN
jgi:hypothetical protein